MFFSSSSGEARRRILTRTQQKRQTNIQHKQTPAIKKNNKQKNKTKQKHINNKKTQEGKASCLSLPFPACPLTYFVLSSHSFCSCFFSTPRPLSPHSALSAWSDSNFPLLQEKKAPWGCGGRERRARTLLARWFALLRTRQPQAFCIRLSQQAALVVWCVSNCGCSC